jgi:hypothetical protein
MALTPHLSEDLMADGQIPVADALFLGEEQTKMFLHSVSCARILAQTTTAVWKEYKDSGVLNFVYGIENFFTPGGKAGPGFAEIETANPKEVEAKINAYFPKLYEEFQRTAKGGPQQIVPWLTHQQSLFEDDRKYLRRVFLEAKKVNQDVDELLRVAIFRWAEVKFASETMLNILGLIPGGGAVGMFVRLGIGTGYPIFVSAVNDWHKASGAKMLFSAVLGAVKSNLPGVGSDNYVMAKANARLVNKPLQQAYLLKWKGGRVNKQAAACKNADAALGKIGLQATATVLTGLSCYYAYQGCQDSANQFWATVDQ